MSPCNKSINCAPMAPDAVNRARFMGVNCTETLACSYIVVII